MASEATETAARGNKHIHITVDKSSAYLPVDGEEGGPPDGGEVVVGHEVALALAGDCAQVADEAAEGAAVDPGELGEEDAVPVVKNNGRGVKCGHVSSLPS